MLWLMILCFSLVGADLPALVKKINSEASWKAKLPSNATTRKTGFLGLHPNPDFRVPVKTHNTERAIIPVTFDARDRWMECREVIDNIRNQGQCGSCWAFAAAEVMSDRLCIQSNGQQKFQFSPQDLLSCCEECGKGCGGGFTYLAFMYFNSDGVVSGGDFRQEEGCKPYEATAFLYNTTPKCKTLCTNSDYKTPFENDKNFGTKDIYLLLEKNVAQIQIEILTNGPVQASFIVYEDFFLYDSGVYNYVSGGVVGGHAVKIIGWGTENNVPYWLVANSWGPDWALKGYFKIRRGTNECGIEEMVLAGTAQVGSSGMRIVASNLGVVLATVVYFFMFE